MANDLVVVETLVPAALMLNTGATEDQGKAVLTAIAGGKVPHVVISY